MSTTATVSATTNLTAADHDKAFSEVSFLLEMLVDTSMQVVGDSAPSTGIHAGRHMAKKLPFALEKVALAEALKAVGEHLSAGFEYTAQASGDVAEVNFTRCAIRDVCQKRGLQVGGPLCQMFHYYLSGMVAEVTGRRVKPTIGSAGATCQTKLEAK